MEDLRALIVKSCTASGLQSLLVDDVHIVAFLPLLNAHMCTPCTCVCWCMWHYPDKCLADVHFCTLYGLLTRNIITSVVLISFKVEGWEQLQCTVFLKVLNPFFGGRVDVWLMLKTYVIVPGCPIRSKSQGLSENDWRQLVIWNQGLSEDWQAENQRPQRLSENYLGQG